MAPQRYLEMYPAFTRLSFRAVPRTLLQDVDVAQWLDANDCIQALHALARLPQCSGWWLVAMTLL